MKKIISLLLVLVMAIGVFALTGCQKKNLKLGLGLSIAVSATDATADKEGAGQATVTAAAVLLDKDGKIVKAFIDCADNKVGYSVDGKATKNAEFKTKYEYGKDYNMVTYGGAAKEWFEQADAFCSVLVGKTLDEVKALVAADYKGTEEVVNAGCTIYVSDFVKAVEAAITNAKETTATEADAIKLGVSTTQTAVDATEDAAGSNKVETTLFAAAVDADGKVVAGTSDCVEVTFTFDATGKSTFDATKEVLSKRAKGDNYGMVAYGGAAKEWYAQADAFDAACAGKTATEIAGLMGSDYKGVADVQAAGCTIYVSGLVKAACKVG